MRTVEVASGALFLVGALFFFAGTVGILRFPDVYTRLHALTKADNLGLGFVAAGLALEAGELAVALKIAMTWALVLLSSGISCHLIARAALRRGLRPWSER